MPLRKDIAERVDDLFAEQTPAAADEVPVSPAREGGVSAQSGKDAA
jgi:hypothetical protein